MNQDDDFDVAVGKIARREAVRFVLRAALATEAVAFIVYLAVRYFS